MVEITLFEFNTDSVDLTANAPFSAATSPEDIEADSGSRSLFGLRGRSGSDDDVEATATEAEDDGGRNPVPIALALGLVVVLFLVGRRVLGGEPEPLPA